MKRHYRIYLLILLLAVFAFTNLDRQVLGLSMESIKLDLDLSDTQLGVLTGFSFAIFYTVLGIPLARWADRGNRVRLIAVTTIMCGISVAFCGFAVSLAQLILIRIAVATGEAGLIPAANSLIPDQFEPTEISRAFSIFMLGGPLSMVIGEFLGGWSIEQFGWRLTFIAMALPGVALGLMVWFSLYEPRFASHRGAAAFEPSFNKTRERAAELTLIQICRALWKNKTFVYITAGNAVYSVFSFGFMQWLQVFFIRYYHLTTGVLGTWLALVFGVGSSLGILLGGRLGSSFAGSQKRRLLVYVAATFVGTGIAVSLIFIVHSLFLALLMLGASCVVSTVGTAPTFDIQQSIVQPRMRAQAMAIRLFVQNLVGMGCGPLVVGVLSDLLTPKLGGDALRWTLLCCFPGYLWAAWYLLRASRTVEEDLARENGVWEHTNIRSRDPKASPIEI